MTDPSTHINRHRIRVRYAETDRMGVAHHMNHVAWLEEGRTEWMRDLGQTYREFEDSGMFLQVVDVQISYRSSVTYDDVVVVETRLAELKRASIDIGYRIEREDNGRLVAEAKTTLACVDPNGKLRRLPEWMGRRQA